jgi:hypothetical protein
MTDQYPPASPTPYDSSATSGYGQQGGYSPAPAGPVPGKTLGIVGFVLAFLASPIGLILSIVAMVQSKKAGAKNGFALAGIIIGAIGTVILIVSIIALVALGSAAAGYVEQVCGELGSGTHTQDGVTFTCP